MIKGYTNLGAKVFPDGRTIQSKQIVPKENESNENLKPIKGNAETGVPVDPELLEGYIKELEKRGELNNTENSDKIIGSAYSPDGQKIELKEYTPKASNKNNNGKPVMQIHFGSPQALANKLGISEEEFNSLSFTEIQKLVEQFNEQHPTQHIIFP